MRFAAFHASYLSMLLLAGCGAREQSAAPGGGKVAASGSSEAAVTTGPQEALERPAPAGPGRYEIAISPQGHASPLLLDTQTGRIWQLREFSGLEGKPTAWQEMTIIDDKAGMGITTAQFQKLYPPRNTAPPREIGRHKR